jgi:carbonic anhydrase/acetyltransferase-like protein (isoleucine patch superfamily)
MALYELDGATPELPPDGDCFIAPTAAVIGKVKLERATSVWFSAVLRGDNELIRVGEGSNIQDGCVLHTDPGFPLTLGRNVTVGHLAMLHGCTVGDNALIGINATVLNGARIGRNSILGANSLLAEGKEIPDSSLAVGAPARVVRALSPDQIALLEQAAEVYIRRQERYRRVLRAILE